MKLNIKKKDGWWRVSCDRAILYQSHEYDDALRVCRFYQEHPTVVEIELGWRVL